MKFGVSVGNLGAFGDEPGVQACLQLAETAEQLGYDSVWVSDHVVRPVDQESLYPYNQSGTRPPPQPDSRISEPLTVLAALAARTTRVRLGTSVLIIPYRNPLILANTLATIDQISRGRVILGIGVGWQKEEFEALGVGEFYASRGRVTDEWMEICIKLWTNQPPVAYEGRFARFPDVNLGQVPVQKPHIPIWVGGKTPAAHRRVARYGNGYLGIGSSPQELKEEIAAVKQEMMAQDRDPDSLVVAMSGGVAADSREELIDRLGQYAEAGLDHLVGTPTTLLQRTATSPSERLELQLEGLHFFNEEIMPRL